MARKIKIPNEHLKRYARQEQKRKLNVRTKRMYYLIVCEGEAKADFHRKLYFNYITANSKYFDRKDWTEKYNYSIHYLDQQPYTLTL